MDFQGAEAADLSTPRLRPLLSYLRRPTFPATPPGRLRVWHWLGWLCLLLLAASLASAFTHLLALAYHWPVPASSARARFLAHPSWAVITILLVAPALEELGFRAFLSSAPRFIFPGLAFFLGYAYLVAQTELTPVSGTLSSATVLTQYFLGFWVFVPAGAISLLLHRYARHAVTVFFQRWAGWVFWTSCVLFGAAHASLYTNHFVWWGLVLALPQFLLGVGLAYLRVSFGLRWSIATHYAIDLSAILGSWLYMSAPPSGPLHSGILAALTAIGFVVVVYGLVALARVGRLHW